MTATNIKKLTLQTRRLFESLVQTESDTSGEQFWFARDLQEPLGYERWQNFLQAIRQAIDSCKSAGYQPENHFRGVTKMVGLKSGAQREVEDYKLTRYACYLIAQNCDPRKEPIAIAQSYFAVQTSKQELASTNQKQLGNTLWSIADQLRGAMDADDFRDYMLSFLFLRYLSDNYETAAKKELGKDYPDVGGDTREVPLALWYANNVDDIPAFEKQMRRKVHYVIRPDHLWSSIANLARTQNAELLNTLQAGFKYIETESFENTFQDLFSGIDLGSSKLGKSYTAH